MGTLNTFHPELYFFANFGCLAFFGNFSFLNDGYPHILLDIRLYVLFIMKMSGTMTGSDCVSLPMIAH